MKDDTVRRAACVARATTLRFGLIAARRHGCTQAREPFLV